MFLSCDWGTSSFRLRLISDQLVCVSTSFSGQGIAPVYQDWLAQNRPAKERMAFYQGIIRQHIQHIERDLKMSLEGIPVITSGMVSSTIGLVELPYQKVPFSVEEAGLTYKLIESTEYFHHPLLVLSGIQTNNDVARGEETALLGSFRKAVGKKQVCIFPGTHSKHIVVENGMATGLKTFMTGEFFQMLSRHSILSTSLEINDDFRSAKHLSAFENGVHQGCDTNLLHGTFMVRTNTLFNKFSPEQNYWFMSGLLIGSELTELPVDISSVSLVSDGLLMDIYGRALEVIDAEILLKRISLEEAIIRGHSIFYRQHFS